MKMVMRINFLLVATVAILSCGNSGTEKAPPVDSQNRIDKETVSPGYGSFQIKGVDIGYENLVLISSLDRKYQEGSTEAEIKKSGCEKWSFTEKDLKGLLKIMKKVEPVEWNAICYNYPCSYVGKVANNNKEYDITINAASVVELANDDEVLYFILEHESEKFLTPCNCCE